jgi:IS1 family transposase
MEAAWMRAQDVTGNPDLKHISTNDMERQNRSVRMTNRRFTRLTNAFSKTIENHDQLRGRLGDVDSGQSIKDQGS